MLPWVTADAKTLLYKKDVVNGPLYGRPLSGGPERRVIDCVSGWGYAVSPRGIYYMACRPGSKDRTVRLLSARTGEDQVIGTLEVGHAPALGMTVSPDGQRILYSRWVAEGADLVMIENFR